MDFQKHRSHFLSEFAFFLRLASPPTAPSGLGIQRDAAPASLCNSPWCFGGVDSSKPRFFTHFLKPAAWWACVPCSSSCLPSVVSGQSFLNVLLSRAPFSRAAGTSPTPHSCSFHITDATFLLISQNITPQSHWPCPRQEESPAQAFLETQNCP